MRNLKMRIQIISIPHSLSPTETWNGFIQNQGLWRGSQKCLSLEKQIRMWSQKSKHHSANVLDVNNDLAGRRVYSCHLSRYKKDTVFRAHIQWEAKPQIIYPLWTGAKSLETCAVTKWAIPILQGLSLSTPRLTLMSEDITSPRVKSSYFM